TRTVRHHGAESVAVCQIYSIEGLRQGTNLVYLYQQGVSCLLIDAALQASWVGSKEVVADDLYLVTDFSDKRRVPLPVVLIEWILNGNNWVLLNELGVQLGHLCGGLHGVFMA